LPGSASRSSFATAAIALRGLLQISAFEDDVLPFEVEERRILVQALRVAGGHVGEAAKLLRIGRATLYRKIKVMDIAEEEWRSPAGAAVALLGALFGKRMIPGPIVRI
jgi:hypothetical protein